MGLSEGGLELSYGFQVALASQPTNFVSFPNVPVSLAWTDRSVRAEHQNLAGDERISYQKILAPTASFTLDGFDLTERSRWRSLAIQTGEFYLFRLLRLERILAVSGVTYSDGGAIKVRLPHSSYSLASKKSVAAGGASVLSSFLVNGTWNFAISDTDSGLITVTAYADATETLTLGGGGVPAAGTVVFINFSASAWLSKVAQGPQFNPITGAAPLHSGAIVFEGA